MEYVIKEDEEFLQSDNHLDLWNSKPPKTNAACSRKKVFTKREPQKAASSDDGTDDINLDIEGRVSEEDKKSSCNKRKQEDLLDLITVLVKLNLFFSTFGRFGSFYWFLRN